MASRSFSLSIRPRGNVIPPRSTPGSRCLGEKECSSTSTRILGKPLKNLPQEVSLPVGASAADLYESIAANAHSSVHRLRITKGSDGSLIPNLRSLVLNSTGLRDQSSIYVKDLGPQVPWRTVFLVEYFGPILIHPLLYARLSAPSTLQTLSMAFITLHFLKRELETLFLHRFSATTMPLFNIFKNSAHYWLLAGLNLAFWIYRPTSPTASPSNPYITYPAVFLYAMGELGNLHAHITLRNLRRAGTTDRGVPRGGAFELVTCPNYMFEVLIWIAVIMVTWSSSAVLFAIVATAQMGFWARKKENRYRREFGSKYRQKRWVVIPGIW